MPLYFVSRILEESKENFLEQKHGGAKPVKAKAKAKAKVKPRAKAKPKAKVRAAKPKVKVTKRKVTPPKAKVKSKKAPVKRPTKKAPIKKKEPKKPTKSRADLYQNLDRNNAKHAKVFRFIDEYPIDCNITAAAIRAGYSKNTAKAVGGQMYANVGIKFLIDEKMKEIASRNEVDQDKVVNYWKSVADQDANAFSSLTVRACRHCHHKEFLYQRTEYEFKQDMARHEINQAQMLEEDGSHVYQEFDEQGGDTYDWRIPPSPDCQVCFGDGVMKELMHDTRNLTDEQKLVYKGVRRTKDGIEILTVDREKGYEALSKYVGLYEKDNAIDITTFDPDEMEAKYAKKDRERRLKHEALMKERGITEENM